MIKNVFFDLDDTLLDFHKSEHNALCKTLLAIGVVPDEKITSRYSVINLEHWKMLEKGLLDKQGVKVGRYRALFEEFGIDYSPEKATKIYEGLLATQYFLTSDAVNTLEALKDRYTLYVVTNGTEHIQKSRLKGTQLEKYFADVFISDSIGYEKPDARFFERSFERIRDFKKSQSVIVGDSLSSDILGGINGGIKTIWLNPSHQTKKEIQPDYEVDSLIKIVDILGKL